MDLKSLGLMDRCSLYRISFWLKYKGKGPCYRGKRADGLHIKVVSVAFQCDQMPKLIKLTLHYTNKVDMYNNSIIQI